MSRNSTKLFAMEVLGRHAGWTIAACAVAAEHEEDRRAAAHCGECDLIEAIRDYETGMLDYGFRAVRNFL